jgi:hypothetical protein
MKITRILIAVLGIVHFGAAIVIAVRDGIVARRILPGSNGKCLLVKLLSATECLQPSQDSYSYC